MDPDAAPLFYLFLKHPEVLDELDAVCNKAPPFVDGLHSSQSSYYSSYPIFSKSKILSSIQQVGGLGWDGYYAVPREGSAKVIKQYASILNSIMNEFSPPPGDIPTSHNYVQLIDCSLALYGKLQQHTVCPSSSAVDSSPFCTLYHLGFSSEEEMKTKASTRKPVFRSSLYYFLPNTMLEFPFAWWHKCILLQGRGVSPSSDEPTIHCAHWREDSIPADQMETLSSLYDEADVRGLMLRLEGGVTSEVLSSAVAALEGTLRYAISNFTASGSRMHAETVVSSDSAASSMARAGAPMTYNMKCYERSSIPDTAEGFIQAGDKKGINCAHNMLMWIKNENASIERYNLRGGTASMPSLGQPGMDPACYTFRERDLVSLSGPSYMLNVFQYLSDRFLGVDGVTEPVMRTGMQLNDFFSDSSFNHMDLGLLAAEFVPPPLTGVPLRTPEFSFVELSVPSDSPLFTQENAPCVTLDSVRDRLPPCQPKKDGPVWLETSHCDEIYASALGDIYAYAQQIDYVPLAGPSRR